MTEEDKRGSEEAAHNGSDAGATAGAAPGAPVAVPPPTHPRPQSIPPPSATSDEPPPPPPPPDAPVAVPAVDGAGSAAGEGAASGGVSPSAGSASNARTMAMLCHLLAFLGLVVPVGGNILGPFILWALKRESMPVVDREGRKSINFQITFSCCLLLVWLGGQIGGSIPVLKYVVVVFGTFVLWGLWIANIVCIVLATIKAGRGESWNYPVSWPVLK